MTGPAPLFSPEGEAALQALAQVRALYAFDFDGTLAPIVTRPEDAQAPASTQLMLSTLAARVPVAVVTGRCVADIRRLLEFTPLHLVGNHGAEGLPSPLGRSLASSVTASGGNADHSAIVRGWLEQWPAAIGTDDLPGIAIEDKTYSLSIHYRRTDDPDVARGMIATAIDRLVPPPHRIGGKSVFNLMPEGAPDKGVALVTLVRFEACDAAFYIGDDDTDERAFATAPAHWVTVKVGSPERTAARFFVNDQADVDACLTLLVRCTEGLRSKGVSPTS